MPEHIYSYNMNAEQMYFLDSMFRDKYDCICLNGNIVSHTPAAVAAFLSTANKPFFINPQTHAFQHMTDHLKRKNKKTDKLEFKPSIEKLARDRLGGIFADVIKNDAPLSPSDFESNGSIDDSKISDICEGTIKFQLRTMLDELGEEEKEFIDKEEMESIKPKFVIAPYFYLSPRRYSQWLDINLECYKCTKNNLNDEDKYTYLAMVISKEALEKGFDEIKSKLKILSDKIEIDGILLWIDNHDEENLTTNDIMNFIKFLKILRNVSSEVINLYGGYLSILFCHEKLGLLDGVCHGINYGENRSVVPVGGGIPMARFYFPNIHSRLRTIDAIQIIRKKEWNMNIRQYNEKVCKCEQCCHLIKDIEENEEGQDQESIINNTLDLYNESNPVRVRRKSGFVTMNYPTADAKRIAAKHYLYNKKREFDMLEDKPLDNLIHNLESAYNDLMDITGDEMISHLDNWNQSIRNEID